MWTGRRRATRRFLAASVAALAVPAALVGWLGWQLLQQDRQLEGRRVQERLTTAADLAAGSIDRALSAAEQHLATLIVAREPDPTAAAAALGADKDDAAVVVIDDQRIGSSAPLLYYPEDSDFSDP